ncbi:hypothetical protein D3C85_1003410 [compost metagenome]
MAGGAPRSSGPLASARGAARRRRRDLGDAAGGAGAGDAATAPVVAARSGGGRGTGGRCRGDGSDRRRSSASRGPDRRNARRAGAYRPGGRLGGSTERAKPGAGGPGRTRAGSASEGRRLLRGSARQEPPFLGRGGRGAGHRRRHALQRRSAPDVRREDGRGRGVRGGREGRIGAGAVRERPCRRTRDRVRRRGAARRPDPARGRDRRAVLGQGVAGVQRGLPGQRDRGSGARQRGQGQAGRPGRGTRPGQRPFRL